MHPFFHSKVASVLLGFLALWMLVLAVAAGIRRSSGTEQLTAIQQRIEDAQRENARLADILERMKRPEWLALMARQRLNYKQPDETVVFVYKNEKVDTLSQPQRTPEPQEPSWRQWLAWFEGKK